MPSDDQKYRPATPRRLVGAALLITCSWLGVWLRIVIAARIPPVGALTGVCVVLVCDGLLIRWIFLRVAAQRAEYHRDPTAFLVRRVAEVKVARARSRWLLWILWGLLWSMGVLAVVVAIVSVGGNAAGVAGALVLLVLGPLGIIACVVLGIRSFRRSRRMTTGADIIGGHPTSE